MTVPNREVAVVWRFGNRRYLTKRAAFMAQAKHIMSDGHESIANDDLKIGARCYCDYCEDSAEGGLKRMVLASQLMREARRAA